MGASILDHYMKDENLSDDSYSTSSNSDPFPEVIDKNDSLSIDEVEVISDDCSDFNAEKISES